MLHTFGRASVPQRLRNQSLYHEILLLQKFDARRGKVLKPNKTDPPASEKKGPVFLVFFLLCLIVWFTLTQNFLYLIFHILLGSV